MRKLFLKRSTVTLDRAIYTEDKPFHRFNELLFLPEIYRIRCPPPSKRNAPVESYFERTIKLVAKGGGGALVCILP